MNILLISHYAGAPQYGMEFRSYYLGREWVRQGHKVLIVGASYSHLRKQQPKPGHEVIDGIDYLWLPTLNYEGNGAKRLITMFQFVEQIYRHQQELVNFAPDAVIASSVYTYDIYPCYSIASKTRRKYHKPCKLAYEVHDLWPLSPMVIGGYSKWHPFIWTLQRGENFAYRHVDCVVSILDKALPHMQRHGLPADRFFHIPNGYLAEEWSQEITSDDSSAHQPLIIGFAGGHTQSTAMHIFIEAARKLIHRKDIKFVLVGHGPQKQDLIELANSYRLTNVEFRPPIPKSEIPQLLQSFDICYAGGVHSFLHQYGTSFNKVIDYMLSGCPIVNSVDEPQSLVERVGCGIQVEAENVDQVANAIEQLANMSHEERQAMGAKGRAYAQQNFEYGTLAKRFVETFNIPPRH